MLKAEILNKALLVLSKEEKALRVVRKSVGDAFYRAVCLIRARSGKIIVTGVGKSGIVGQKISATLTSLGHGSVFLHPTEAFHGDSGLVQDGDIILVLSSSGETAELVRLIKYFKKNFNVKIISILTKSKDSTIAKLSDSSIVALIVDEGSPLGLAPMASTTASMVIGDLIAAVLTSPRDFQHRHFAKFHPGGALGLSLKKVHEVMKTDELPIVEDHTPFREAIGEINSKKLGFVAVISKSKKLSGIITDGDVRRFFIANDSATGLTAGSVMKAQPKTISKDAPLSEAVSVMQKFKITTLLVSDSKDNLIGVVHIHDILREFN